MNSQHKLNRQRNRLHRILRQLISQPQKFADGKTNERAIALQSRADEILISNCSYIAPLTRAEEPLRIAIVSSIPAVA